MEVNVTASGGPGTGKTFILMRVVELLESYGFTSESLLEIAEGLEEVSMTRKDDRVHFIQGERRLKFGDWEIELDNLGTLVEVYYKGKATRASEVKLTLGHRTVPLITLETVAVERG